MEHGNNLVLAAMDYHQEHILCGAFVSEWQVLYGLIEHQNHLVVCYFLVLSALGKHPVYILCSADVSARQILRSLDEY